MSHISPTLPTYIIKRMTDVPEGVRLHRLHQAGGRTLSVDPAPSSAVKPARQQHSRFDPADTPPHSQSAAPSASQCGKSVSHRSGTGLRPKAQVTTSQPINPSHRRRLACRPLRANGFDGVHQIDPVRDGVGARRQCAPKAAVGDQHDGRAGCGFSDGLLQATPPAWARGRRPQNSAALRPCRACPHWLPAARGCRRDRSPGQGR